MGHTWKPVLRVLPTGGCCCWVICTSAPISLGMFSMRVAPRRLKFLLLGDALGVAKWLPRESPWERKHRCCWLALRRWTVVDEMLEDERVSGQP